MGHAIPYWTTHGLDATGLAYEESDFFGVMRETGYRRTVVQFRQSFVFAYASLMGSCDRGVAQRLFARTVAIAWHPEGGWVHRLDSAGNVLDPTRDAYDQAFALLASAWVYRLDNDRGTLAWAYRTLEFMDRHMSSPFGGYEEAVPARAPRRQNPHMHLYEALLCLYEVSGDGAFLERARVLAQLLESHFMAASGALREYFGGQLEPLSGKQGECVEPGHHAEWSWLLHEHARLDPSFVSSLARGGTARFDRARKDRALRPHTPGPAARLLAFVERHGLSSSGLPVEQLDTAGAVTNGGTKLWALCETLKAYVVRAESVGSSFDPAVSLLLDAIFEQFLCHESAPIWFEGVLADGLPDRKRMPTSTLYHLTLAFAELLRFAGLSPRMLRVDEAP